MGSAAPDRSRAHRCPPAPSPRCWPQPKEYRMAQQMRVLMPPTPAAQDPVTTTLADICRYAFVHVPPTGNGEQAVRPLPTPAMRRVPVVDGGQLVDMVSLGNLAVERDPDSARGKRSGAPPVPHRGKTRTTDTPAVSAAHEREKPMEAMREETQAEEHQIGQERAQSEARLGALAVLQRRIREL